MIRTLEDIANEIAEKQKQLKTFQTSQYTVEDEILKLQKRIIELQGEKKDKEIAAAKGRYNIRQLLVDLKILTNEYWNLKT